MSDKGRVFKAHFTIIDNVHHCHLHEHFTTARRETETLQHFIIRLLGFCLFAYRHDLVLCESKTKPQLDIFASTLYDDYELVIEVFNDNIDELTKIRNQSRALYVITVTPLDPELAHWLELNNGVELIVVDNEAVAELEAVLSRSMHWDVCVDSDELAVSANDTYIRSPITIRWP